MQKHWLLEERDLVSMQGCLTRIQTAGTYARQGCWFANSRMPLRRRSRRRKLTPVTVLVLVALIAGIALVARVSRSRSAAEPASGGACGHWQQKYAKLHRQVLAGRRPRRLCIATTRDEQGLYDRLTGLDPHP